MPSASSRPLYPTIQSDGLGHHSLLLKRLKVMVFEEAARPNGPVVFWEIRDFFDGLGYKGKGRKLCRWLTEQNTERAAVARNLGLDLRDFRQSLRALVHGMPGGSGVPEHFSRFCAREYTFSTAQLLSHLALWHARVAKHETKFNCECMLAVLFKSTLAPRQLPQEVPPPDQNDDGETSCEHVRHLLATMKDLNVNQPRAQIWAKFFCEVAPFMISGESRAVCRWVAKHIFDIAARIDSNLRSQAWPDTPKHVKQPRGPRRHRRLDPEVGKLSLQMQQKKRFRSTARMFAAGLVDLPNGSAATVDVGLTADYHYSMQQALEGQTRLQLSTDATDLGEKTLNTCFWSHELQLGGWFCPQAPF